METGKIEEKKKEEKLSKLQLTLLIFLYGLLVLMLIFSINARKNIGKDGFDLCIQKKCQMISKEHCSKLREIFNCCQGAGGKLVLIGNQYTCSFS